MAVTRASRTARRTPIKPAGTAARASGSTSRIDSWASPRPWSRSGSPRSSSTRSSRRCCWGPLFGVPYEVDGYLSPFFSPLIGQGILPAWFSPAILILWIPLGFRTTCYYYRKAYYRAYFVDPPACAVGEPQVHRRYSMETAFPFILQNLHRVFLYLAFIPLFFLWLDALRCRSTTTGQWRLGPRQRDPVRERRAAGGLLAVVPLAAPPRRRHARLLLVHAQDPDPLQPLAAADGAQRQPHALGVVEPHLGGVRRPVRPAARAGLFTDPRIRL